MSEMEFLSNKKVKDSAFILRAQDRIMTDVEDNSIVAKDMLDDLNALSNKNVKGIEEIWSLLKSNPIDDYEVNKDDLNLGLAVKSEIRRNIQTKYKYKEVESFKVSENWSKLLSNSLEYTSKIGFDLNKDPLEDIMNNTQRDKLISQIKSDYAFRSLELDKYDYMFASFSGIICGLIDSIFIGAPRKVQQVGDKVMVKNKRSKDYSESKLNTYVHNNFDKIIIKIANLHRKIGGKEGNITSISGAVRYLEASFPVNYDAVRGSDLGIKNSDIRMTPSNHHLRSLAHHPDIIGMFFSILDQFNNSTSIVYNGRISVIKNPEGETQLQGKNFFEKIICGFLNWLGHLASDVAGSSKARSDGGRGKGIPLPLYSLTQMITLKFKGKNDTLVSFSKIAEHLFTDGYDFRFGITLSIPVVLNELVIKLFYSLKSHFKLGKDIKDIVFGKLHQEFNRLLLIGHGSLCIVDGSVSAIKAGGTNVFVFLGNANIVAWTRFSFIAYKEVKILHQKIGGINLEHLDSSLESEWERLFKESKKIYSTK